MKEIWKIKANCQLYDKFNRVFYGGQTSSCPNRPKVVQLKERERGKKGGIPMEVEKKGHKGQKAGEEKKP